MNARQTSRWWTPKIDDESKRVEGQIVAESVGSLRTVTALQLQAFVSGLYGAALPAPTKRKVRNAYATSANAGFAHVVSNLCFGAVFFIGAEFRSRGVLTVQQMFVTVFVVLVSAPAIGRSASSLPDELAGRVGAARLFRIIDRVPAIDSSAPRDDDGGDGDGKDKDTATSSCQGAIELRDVHFAYPTRPDVPVFQGYSLAIPAGKTVALVGESGGGKSTVISLLERFYDPQQGRVLLDGRDVRTLNVQWLREQIGLVSQEPVLFASSIMENIRHGKRGATDEEVVEAAKMANADGFISSFPDGYDTEVGERGVQLSGGQKQRIAIARAVIKDPTILLLDEATSALDSESERVVQAALDDLMKAKRRTTIVVAHRLSTVRDADSIAVVYNGKIVEQGTHDELMGIQNGNYRRLASRQQAKGEEN